MPNISLITFIRIYIFQYLLGTLKRLLSGVLEDNKLNDPVSTFTVYIPMKVRQSPDSKTMQNYINYHIWNTKYYRGSGKKSCVEGWEVEELGEAF